MSETAPAPRSSPAVSLRPSGCVADLLHRFSAVIDEPTLALGVAELAEAIRRDPGDSEAILDSLSARFALSRFEREVLVLVGLAEEHEFISHAARRLHPSGESRLSFAAVAETLGLDGSTRLHLRRALDGGQLTLHGLVRHDERIPLPDRGLRLAPGLWSVIRGIDHWPTGTEPVPVVPHSDPGIDCGQLGRALDGGQLLVVLTGDGNRPATDLASALSAAMAALRTPASFFEAARFDEVDQQAVAAHCVARSSVPVIIGQPKHAPLPRHPGPVVICAEQMTGVPLDSRPVVAFDLAGRDLRANVAMWSELVPELNGSSGRLASLLRVDHRRAAEAVADARTAASTMDAGLEVADIVSQVRRRSGTTLPASVRLVKPATTLDDLVTTPANADLLQSILDRVDAQATVLHDWGFGARNSSGVRALFSGPPGTGKTMSAEIVAHALGLDLLVVDLSALVSKWLGETEKNISEVFDTAERTQAVLFFDEADSIFARRTDSSDAQGRWANLETSHLLSRMERFAGLIVLATNLRGNIDDAFVRRLDVIIEFDEPGAEERQRLWDTHLPDLAPMADDVDLRQLAALYPVTGGLIRNASLDAAFRAAARRTCIDQRSLVLAVEREYHKAGRSFPGIPRGLVDSQSGGF